MPHESRRYVLMVVAYLSSRALLAAAGLRIRVSYDWLFFHDVELLQDRLLESLWYTHAFPPGMNLMAGLVLQSGVEPTVAYTTLFWALGALFVVSMAKVARSLGLSWRTTAGLVGLFALSPPTLLFEHLLFHTFPAAALLMASIAAFAWARGRGAVAWSVFFTLCALLAFFRSSFHLVWLVGLIAFAVAQEWDRAGAVLRGAVVPLALVLMLYAKNASLVGSFGASSWVGFNLAKVTTQQLPPRERRAWAAQDRMHPVSALPLYAPPAAYSRVIDAGPPMGVAVLDTTHRSQGPPNYNHRVYAVASRARMVGNLAYLRAHPGAYLSTVSENVREFVGPSTRWHPRDATRSPHQDHRRVLGGWERFWNAVVHGWFSPIGLYLPLGLLVVASGGTAVFRTVRGPGDPADGVRLLLAGNIVWVAALSCLVETGELARYRFLIEAPLWLLAASTLQSVVARIASVRRWNAPTA